MQDKGVGVFAEFARRALELRGGHLPALGQRDSNPIARIRECTPCSESSRRVPFSSCFACLPSVRELHGNDPAVRAPATTTTPSGWRRRMVCPGVRGSRVECAGNGVTRAGIVHFPASMHSGNHRCGVSAGPERGGVGSVRVRSRCSCTRDMQADANRERREILDRCRLTF